jgi:5-hydroxyisourate hydrolase-like protein (transthyretin family)
MSTAKFALYQNFPNPFNPRTTIKYQVPNQSYVVIKLFNSLSQEIRTLVNEERNQGRYELLINGSELTSGVYFCQMRAGNFVETKKIVLMK